MTLTLALLTAVTLAQPRAASCPPGKSVGPDTQGQCCWPDQVWSGSRKACVGIPRCPHPLTVQGEDCKVVCPAGMEVNADTQGQCCWPGQVWSGSRKSCVGIPQCPAGLQAEGEMCVASAQPAPPPVAPPPPSSAPPPPAPPPSGTAAASAPPPPPSDAPAPLVAPTTVPGEAQVIDGLTVPPGHHIEKRMRKGLLIPGIALLGAGWLVSVLVSVGGGIYTIFEPTNTCWRFASSVGWIPLIGPPIAIGGQTDPSLRSDSGRRCTEETTIFTLGAGVAIVDTIMQWGGLTMMILGLTVRQSVVVPDNPEAADARGALAPELYVNVGAPGSPLGLTLGLKTW